MIETLRNIALILGSVGIFATGAGYAWGQFFKGRNDRKLEENTITVQSFTLMQSQVASLQEMVERDRKRHTEERAIDRAEINRLTGEIGRLNGILQEKDGKLKEYKEIFQGRDPRMDKFMDAMEQFMTRNSLSLESIDAHLQKTQELEETLLDIHKAVVPQAGTPVAASA